MDNVEELEKICQKILKLDTKMRSSRLINGRGHLIAGGMKKDYSLLKLKNKMK